MNIAVIGSRTVTDYDHVKTQLDRFIFVDEDVIVSGGARGADELGERYAREFCSKEPLIFPADWEKHGRNAGYIRNHDIIDNADMVIAFHDGESKGTAHSLKLAKELDKITFVLSDKAEPLDGVFTL